MPPLSTVHCFVRLRFSALRRQSGVLSKQSHEKTGFCVSDLYTAKSLLHPPCRPLQVKFCLWSVAGACNHCSALQSEMVGSQVSFQLEWRTEAVLWWKKELKKTTPMCFIMRSCKPGEITKGMLLFSRVWKRSPRQLLKLQCWKPVFLQIFRKHMFE